jgi:PAS domain S-box-containing protein
MAAYCVSTRLTPAEQLAFDAAPVMIWVAGPDAESCWFNRSWLEFTGRTMADELAGGWAQGVHRDDIDRRRDSLGRAFAARGPFELDYRLRHRDGSYRWVMDRATPRWAADGTFLGFVGAAVDIQARRDLQASLERARDEAGKAADSIPALVFKTGPKGGMSYANRAWVEYTGYEPNVGSAGKGWAPLVHKDDEHANRRAWRASLASGEAFETAYRLRRHDGVYRWHYVHAVPVCGVDGIEAWYGTCADIDDKVRTDIALQASEERLRLAQRVAGMGTWEWDIPGNVVTWSPEMEEIYGLSQFGHDGAFDSYMDRTHPEDREMTLAAVEALLKTGLLEMEHRIVRADGEVRWLEARGELFRDEAGRPVRAIGVGLDITERKQYELALGRTDGRLRMLADVGAALVIADPESEMLASAARAITRGFADLCVIDIAEGGVFNRLAVEYSDALDAEAAEVLRTEPPRMDDGGDIETRVYKGGAPVLTVAAYGQGDHVRSERHRAAVEQLSLGAVMVLQLRHDDQRHGVLVLARAATTAAFDADDREAAMDLSRRIALSLSSRRMTLQLRSQSAVKDEVLGLISHELRTPLTTLKGNASTLVRHGSRVSDADRQIAIEDIRTDADRLERIIENMLVLARVEGATEIELEPTLLHHVVRSVATEFAGRFPQHELRLDLTHDTLLVLGHETYLRQVVMNLLTNSVKYGHGTAIEVSTARAGDHAVLTVSDRGPGLSDQLLAKVFEPFFRSRRDAARAPGVGLGLTVCRRLLDELGGRIEARQREGGGAQFAVTLPLMGDVDE